MSIRIYSQLCHQESAVRASPALILHSVGLAGPRCVPLCVTNPHHLSWQECQRDLEGSSKTVSVCRQLHRCAPCADTGHLLAVPSSAAFSPCEIKQIIQGRSDLLFWLSLCFGVCSARLCSASKSSIAHAEPGKGNIQLQNTYSSSAPEYGRTSL